MKKHIISVLCAVFIICLVAFPRTSVSAALKGINLWFDIVFPSLFPFFAASEILHETGFVKSVGRIFERLMRPLFNIPGCGSFALAMGVTSGYPTGAKITCDLRLKGYISKTEAERLLAFSNNSGPLYITGAVATGMLNSPELGIPLLICHVSASFTVGMLFRFYKGGSKNTRSHKRLNNNARLGNKAASSHGAVTPPGGSNVSNFGKVFGDAVRNSVAVILQIGGFIILFSVIINLLLQTGAITVFSTPLYLLLKPLGISMESVRAVICGLIEITTGSNYASAATGSPPALKLAALSFIIGWSGLSVHSQVLSIVAKTDIGIYPYLVGKFLHGLISAFYTFIFARVALPAFSHSRPFSPAVPSVPPMSFFSSFASSLAYVAAIIAVYCLLYLIFIFTKQKKLRF